MDRVNEILFHPRYQQYYQEIQSLEKDRKFCGHTMEHFLAVARLSFIMAQKKGVAIDEEVIYAAALLHDVGRSLEYRKSIPHHEGSVMIAQELLPECGFDDEETAEILRVIKGHRQRPEVKCQIASDEDDFATIFYQADKLARNCFECVVAEECNWSKEKKNKRIIL